MDVEITHKTSNKLLADVENDKILIATSIYKNNQLIKLGIFYKNHSSVSGRCELKKFLDYLIVNGYVDDEYTMRVISPRAIKGKTIDNTYEMYENMGFRRSNNDILEEKVKVLLKKLCKKEKKKETKNQNPSKTKSQKLNECKKDKILNPKTNRCVSIGSATYKKLVKEGVLEKDIPPGSS